MSVSRRDFIKNMSVGLAAAGLKAEAAEKAVDAVFLEQVVADTVQIQVEETKPGITCADVAYKIHQYQVKNGMKDYIYHRPAHGSGQNFEGHQPPFISLGDHTVIEEGMTFSVEPGLYDEKNGTVSNPSDNHRLLKMAEF
jgi:Xaa-Pro aminopeptidase